MFCISEVYTLFPKSQEDGQRILKSNYVLALPADEVMKSIVGEDLANKKESNTHAYTEYSSENYPSTGVSTKKYHNKN